MIQGVRKVKVDWKEILEGKSSKKNETRDALSREKKELSSSAGLDKLLKNIKKDLEESNDGFKR